eukprot:TRINITY_DN33122_c0_g1_i2.p1 TRINITY_DN33122_c0_g1~~TRINITY_DN33122_c0_g1_i2.p1  ORF type:complete len:271 (-),score=-28.41 TRINITY_DN33122_c0_g1_i2:18-830(-)
MTSKQQIWGNFFGTSLVLQQLLKVISPNKRTIWGKIRFISQMFTKCLSQSILYAYTANLSQLLIYDLVQLNFCRSKSFLSLNFIQIVQFQFFLCGISVLKNLDNTERSLYLLNFVFHMAKELLSLFDKYNTYLPNTQKQTAKKFGKSMEISVQIFLVTSILVINTILLTYNRNTIYTVQVLLVGHLQIGNLSNIKFWVRMFQQKFSHCKRGSLKFQTVSGEFCILQSLIQYRNFHNNIISQFSSFQFCIHLIDIKFLTIKLICVQIKQMI